MHIYATKHGQISRKNSFCAPLFAERRIASIFDFIFDFWYANNLRLKFKKVKLVLRLKRRFSTIFVLPDLSFFDVFVLPEFSVLLLGGNFDNSWLVDDPCGPVALFNDPDNPGLVSFLFLNVLKIKQIRSWYT